MRIAAPLAVVVLMAAPALTAQEREVPKDSARISIPGCTKNRSFVVVRPPAHEPVRSDVAPGRRFRLSGKKAIIEDIKKHEGSMIEITGLVRQSQLAGPGGVTIGGARISGGPPRAPMTSSSRTDSGYNEAVIDVESWRLMTEACPTN
jgi:hypothetical protein